MARSLAPALRANEQTGEVQACGGVRGIEPHRLFRGRKCCFGLSRGGEHAAQKPYRLKIVGSYLSRSLRQRRGTIDLAFPVEPVGREYDRRHISRVLGGSQFRGCRYLLEGSSVDRHREFGPTAASIQSMPSRLQRDKPLRLPISCACGPSPVASLAEMS
ncbi:MAG TPA: hypothetical protein VLV50_04280 [Stellaceae bacterium]|nr:hypothetical protein [Stellaceae bacterium]